MSKEQLYEAFTELFPDWAQIATSYKKIGSKTLAIEFTEFMGNVEIKTSRVFLYNDPNNWQFGTKLWRKRPENRVKKEEKKDEA